MVGGHQLFSRKKTVTSSLYEKSTGLLVDRLLHGEKCNIHLLIGCIYKLYLNVLRVLILIFKCHPCLVDSVFILNWSDE